MGLDIRLRVSEQDETVVAESILGILRSTRLLALSTMDSASGVWANSAYFAFDRALRLFILTPPGTRHAMNVASDSRCSVAISDTQQTGDGGKCGLQAIGECSLAGGTGLESGLAAYTERFPAVGGSLASVDSMIAAGMESRLYQIRLTAIKVFDEPRFGAETWLDVECP